jgi:Na+-translocating ferredoxin:NAD+ oxidoreductase RnfD subunit
MILPTLFPELLAGILILLQAGDIYTTWRCRQNPKNVESNMFIGFLIRKLGFVDAMMVKVLFVATAAGAALITPGGWIALAIFCAVYVWIIHHNWKLI